MCYKDERQKQLYNKLMKDFEKLDVPEFIQRYFVLLKSSISKINYWTTIRSMLEYMIEKKSINKINIAEIQPEDFLNIDIVLNEDGFPVPEKKVFDIGGKKFSQLPDELQDRFKEYQLPVMFNLNCTKMDIAFFID